MPPRKLQRNLTDIYEAHLPTMNKMVSVPDISHFEDI
jgi:ATP-binding cassette subfamily B (MDR/TAP) protein 1